MAKRRGGLAFHLDPVHEAKVHLLVVPKKHVKNLDALDDAKLAGQLIMAVRGGNSQNLAWR